MKNKDCKTCKAKFGCFKHQNIEVKVKDVAKRTKWVHVKRSFEFFYPDTGTKINKKAFNVLINAKYKKVDKSEFVEIAIIREEDGFDDWITTSTNKYSLSFRPWEKIANFYLKKEVLESLYDSDIIAHVLYEMTWYGDEKKTQKIGNDLHKTVTKARKAIDKK